MVNWCRVTLIEKLIIQQRSTFAEQHKSCEVPGKAVENVDQLKKLYSDGEEKPHFVRLFRYFDQEFN